MWSNFMWVLGSRILVFVSTNADTSLTEPHPQPLKIPWKFREVVGTKIWIITRHAQPYTIREARRNVSLLAPKQGANSLIDLVYRGAGCDETHTTEPLSLLPTPILPHEASANPRLLDWARRLFVSASWTINSRGDSTHRVTEALISWEREFAFWCRDDRKVVVLGTHMAFPKEEPSARSLVAILGSGLPSVHPWGWLHSFLLDEIHKALSRQGQHPDTRLYLPSATPLWLSSRCCSYLNFQLRLQPHPHGAKDERCEGHLTKKMKVI